MKMLSAKTCPLLLITIPPSSSNRGIPGRTSRRWKNGVPAFERTGRREHQHNRTQWTTTSTATTRATRQRRRTGGSKAKAEQNASRECEWGSPIVLSAGRKSRPAITDLDQVKKRAYDFLRGAPRDFRQCSHTHTHMHTIHISCTRLAESGQAEAGRRCPCIEASHR